MAEVQFSPSLQFSKLVVFRFFWIGYPIQAIRRRTEMRCLSLAHQLTFRTPVLER